MIARRVLGLQAGQQHAAQAVGTHRGGQPCHRLLRLGQRAAVDAGQPLQLEAVGRRDVGVRQRMVAQEFLDAFAHIDAFLNIADHRIAAIDRARVRLAHARDGVQDRLADAGVAHVAGQHRVAMPQHVARGDAVHQLAHRSPV